MKKTAILTLILLIPLVYGAAECKPSSDVVIACDSTNCIYNMDNDIVLSLNVLIDNIGLEGTQVKFYLHEVGKQADCMESTSNCLQSGSAYTKYITNGKADVSFEKLGEYKEVEVTARIMKDNSLILKPIFVRPSIRTTLSYPSSNMQGIYETGQPAKVNVEIKDLVSQSVIVSPASFICTVTKGTQEISNKQCSPTEISFTPNSVGTYRIWAKAEYTGLDPSTGSQIPYFPSEDFIDISVQLPQQKITTTVGGEDIKSLPKVGDSYEIERQSYTFQISSSIGNRPYPFDECSIKISAPDLSETTYAIDNSADKKIITQKCTESYDECVYTFSYDFKTAGDQYTLSGYCEKGDFVQTFDTKFITKQTPTECTKGFIQCNLGLVIGVAIGIIVIIGFIILLSRVRKPRSPEGGMP